MGKKICLYKKIFRLSFYLPLGLVYNIPQISKVGMGIRGDSWDKLLELTGWNWTVVKLEEKAVRRIRFKTTRCNGNAVDILPWVLHFSVQSTKDSKSTHWDPRLRGIYLLIVYYCWSCLKWCLKWWVVISLCSFHGSERCLKKRNVEFVLLANFSHCTIWSDFVVLFYIPSHGFRNCIL